jgi:hypothetical protein
MRQVQPEASRRTVIFLPIYKISSLKITPPKTPNSGQFSYPLPNIVSFLFRLEFRFRSRDFSFNLFPVWQPYCWRFWSARVVHIHTSTINAPELRERINTQSTLTLLIMYLNCLFTLERCTVLKWFTDAIIYVVVLGNMYQTHFIYLFMKKYVQTHA